MNVIYKYELDITRKQSIEVPIGCEILKVAEQNGGLFVWARVDTESEINKLPFVIYGTGHEIDMYGFTHIDSVLMANGLVWHVFCGAFNPN